MSKIKDHSLYLVISEKYALSGSAFDIATQAIAGGVDILQMREKDKSREELVRLAKTISAVCKKNGTIFIVNDDPEIALISGADGVHLGQEDMKRFPLKLAREKLGKDHIIGVSTHSVEQFSIANEADVDYIAFGPIFPTLTKNYCIGTGDVGNILGTAKKPVFFIGGINLANLNELLREGASNIAVIRAILSSDDVELKVREFKRLLSVRKEH